MTPPTISLASYAELHCLSNFSFLRGASHPEELIARAADLGYSALALTDECSLAGVVRAHTEARKRNFHLIIGASFELSEPDSLESNRPTGADSAHPGKAMPLSAASQSTPAGSLVVLAQNREGYGNLCELITLARSRGIKGCYALARSDFTAPPDDLIHLRGMPDCLAILAPPYGIAPNHLIEQAFWLAAVFGQRAWIGLSKHHRSREDLHRSAVEQAAVASGLPIVAIGQVEMHMRSRKPLHDTLAAIRLKDSVKECGYRLASNAERHLRTRLRLSGLYPVPILEQTQRIAALCTFSLDDLRYEYPHEIIPAGMTPAAYLRQETYLGASRRFADGLKDKFREQIEKELDLIAQLKYEPYFLTVYDIVRYARSRQILCQGRGSAANSIICYCLGITEVDPNLGNLLFERFISKARNEPPDIDVDFEHQRREEVIQYIYQKYGRDRAALTAVVISYRPRSVLRDTGRALGVDAGVIDAVARAHQWWDGKTVLLRTFEQCGLDAESMLARQWAALAETLMGFPRHLSQHPGGFVMSRGKLSRMVPIENAAMPERSVVQWDKNDLDEIGLLKVDVLALGMLSAIRRTLGFVAQRRGRSSYTLQDIPKEDTKTYDMICEADTIGVFQIESRAQMTMLPRLKPREYYDLVIEVAIVRPGPIQGGMVHPYLRRRQKLEPAEYPSPAIRGVLERTLGVPIFQEQVMQIAMVGAGFSAEEADSLRRSMAAWQRKGSVDKFRDKLINGLLANGYSREFGSAVFRQIEGFGEYGFPESHAASFALLAYTSAWLKCHEPEAFLAGLLNSQPMGFYSPSQLVQDARRHGVQVLDVDVLHSEWEATLEPSTTQKSTRPAVRLGLNLVKGLTEQAGLRIGAQRALGSFESLADLARRAELPRPALDALAAANALSSLVGHRRHARWHAAAGPSEHGLLRRADIVETHAPVLIAPTEGQTILDDYATLGLTLNRHPLCLLRSQLTKRHFVTASVLFDYPSKRLSRACGIVTMRQRPPTAKGTMFVTLEDETGTVNVIVRAQLIEKQRKELLGAHLLGVFGVWQNEQNVRHLVAERLTDLSPLLGDLAPKSRDFH